MLLKSQIILKIYIGIVLFMFLLICLVELVNFYDIVGCAEKMVQCDENYTIKINETIEIEIVPNKIYAATDLYRTDRFSDLMKYLQNGQSKTNQTNYRNVIIKSVESKIRVPTLAKLLNKKPKINDTSLRRLHMAINLNDLYRESDPIVTDVLRDISMLPISKFEEKSGGTQLKLIAYFSNGMKALFKPIIFGLDEEQNLNHLHYSYRENARAEIAAYHLDRALGFRRAMPTVGRKINMITDLYDKLPEDMQRTFYQSPANNTCFYGLCNWYCDIHHAVCGNGDDLEGSFSAYLPTTNDGWDVDRMEITNPWAREYKKVIQKWENNATYCNAIRDKPPFDVKKRFLDLIDMIIFDFLLDNRDRHDFDVFENFGKSSFTIHLDHGRAFARAYIDDLSLLTALRQCCEIRESTLQTILKFHNGPKRLSQIMRESLATDPLAPVIGDVHLQALDRRIGIVLNAVRNCIHQMEL